VLKEDILVCAAKRGKVKTSYAWQTGLRKNRITRLYPRNRHKKRTQYVKGKDSAEALVRKKRTVTHIRVKNRNSRRFENF